MLKHENKAVKGDIIRAYDFAPMAGRGDCYVEGKVIDANCNEPGYKCYKIEITADKFDGDVETEMIRGNRIASQMYVPYEVSFMEYDFRVINLGKFVNRKR
jgi:hypothetical protein